MNKGISIVRRSYLLLFQRSMIDAGLNMQAHANVFHVEPARTLSFYASLSSLSQSAAGGMMELVLMKLPVRHTVALLRKRTAPLSIKDLIRGHYPIAISIYCQACSLDLVFQQYLYRAVM